MSEFKRNVVGHLSKQASKQTKTSEAQFQNVICCMVRERVKLCAETANK